MKYIIYKIQIKDYIYIGSTQRFTQRKAHHKSSCNNGNDTLVYRTIRENGGWDCCTMVPIKEIEVESKTQAHIAEEAARIEYNAQMNTNRAYQTEEEFKEQIRLYQQTDTYKEYHRQLNKTEARKEYQRQRDRQTYIQSDTYKQNKKEYQQTPKYKEYQKQYRLAKKLKLAESSEIKVET